MRCYMAGTFSRRKALRPWRDKLWELGIHVTSSWLDEVKKMPWMTPAEFDTKLALKDLCEVAQADLVICETGELKSEGKSIEFGFALAHYQEKMIWIVGKQRSVFHQLADRTFETWEDCVAYLEKTHGSN